MADKQWKAFERWIAREIGGVRNTVSGRARGSEADVENQDLSVEAKWRGRGRPIPGWILDAIDQAKKAAAKAAKDQTPIVVVHVQDTPHDDDIVMMPWSSFKRLYPGAE